MLKFVVFACRATTCMCNLYVCKSVEITTCRQCHTLKSICSSKVTKRPESIFTFLLRCFAVCLTVCSANIIMDFCYLIWRYCFFFPLPVWKSIWLIISHSHAGFCLQIHSAAFFAEIAHFWAIAENANKSKWIKNDAKIRIARPLPWNGAHCFFSWCK